MKAVLPLFVFIDACGWEIIRHDPFARAFAPNRKRLESVFGYSSACVPAILSGNWPETNRNWTYFVYDPEHSPFRALKPLALLPKAVTSRRIFRRHLSRFIKKPLHFSGYFDLYNVPFRDISLFNFTEKRSPLKPGGMNRGENIFDLLEKRGISYHVSDPEKNEVANMEEAIRCIQQEQIDFAFVYWAELDGLLHQVGNRSPEIPLKLRVYEQRLERMLDIAHEHYDEVRLYVFSDHGMANCDVHLDLKSKIEALDLKWKKDYIVVYDSTMARFWFFNDRARRTVDAFLKTIPEGRILPDSELKELRTFFSDRYFGEMIFLVREGILIVPSHMGERPIRAMHGYHPAEAQSYAALLTNQPSLADDITAIPHVFKLMAHEAEEARRENSSPRSAAETAAEGIPGIDEPAPVPAIH